jgi:hypothetical protein
MEYLSYFRTFDEAFWTLTAMTSFTLVVLVAMSITAINSNTMKELQSVLHEIKPIFLFTCCFIFVILGFISIKGTITFTVMAVVLAFFALAAYEWWREYSWMRFNASKLKNPEEVQPAK